MGQSPSISSSGSLRRETSHRMIKPTRSSSTVQNLSEEDDFQDPILYTDLDYISELPDECLACVFQSLGSGDRKRCSLVCRRWLLVEGQSRHRLSLDARSDLLPCIPSLFARFDSISKLALKCDRRSKSINDDGLTQISKSCPKLTRLKLRACRELTDIGIIAFAKNCKGLKKLSCGSCNFGAKGMNAVLENCSLLEELSVKRLRGITEGTSAAEDLIGPGAAAASLKSICLKELYNGQCFGPLIVAAKNLKTLKLFRCSGDWDRLLEMFAEKVNCLVEVHLERLQVSDRGLAAISNCLTLEILHLVKTPECTNVGLVSIADRCKLLRKLHIDGWKTNRIGDEGLIAIARRCPKLQELVLIGVNPTSLSLGLLAANCQNLERLALCGSETIGDAEISCIAAKCAALRKLCIKGCPVSDHGMEALAGGCPSLVKVKVKKCRGVTSEGANWLRESRESLAVNLDTGSTEHPEAIAVEGAPHDNHAEATGGQVTVADMPSSSTGRSSLYKAKLSFIASRNFVACALRKWSSNTNNGT
ncbi:putative VIER F-box protein 1 [Ranunculus cassubicifolius]